MFASKALSGLLLLVFIVTAGCGGGTSENLPTASIDTTPADTPTSTTNEVSTVPQLSGGPSEAPATPPVELFPEVTIATSLGNIRVRLDAENAPETVDNFLYNYVEKGFYQGTVFHFVKDESIAIAGGYDAELQPKEPSPPIRNEAGNGLKNLRGTIAMSREFEYADSATSQFYFNLADNPSLDQTDSESGETFGYCVFGEVVEGIDVLQKIAKVEVHDADDFFKNVPVQPIVIESVRRDK